jgi:hypothetical protein
VSKRGTGPWVAMEGSDAEARAEIRVCWSIRTEIFVGSSSDPAASGEFQPRAWQPKAGPVTLFLLNLNLDTSSNMTIVRPMTHSRLPSTGDRDLIQLISRLRH